MEKIIFYFYLTEKIEILMYAVYPVFIISISGLTVFTFIKMIGGFMDDVPVIINTLFKNAAICTAISGFLLLVVPSKTVMYGIIGGTAITQVYDAYKDSPQAISIVNNSVALVNKKIELELKKIEEESKKIEETKKPSK